MGFPGCPIAVTLTRNFAGWLPVVHPASDPIGPEISIATLQWCHRATWKNHGSCICAVGAGAEPPSSTRSSARYPDSPLSVSCGPSGIPIPDAPLRLRPGGEPLPAVGSSPSRDGAGLGLRDPRDRVPPRRGGADTSPPSPLCSGTSKGPTSSSRAATAYGDVLSGIYRALAAATGSGVVVDSSKHPAEALLLAARSDVDLTVLHVVRDPRRRGLLVEPAARQHRAFGCRPSAQAGRLAQCGMVDGVERGHRNAHSPEAPAQIHRGPLRRRHGRPAALLGPLVQLFGGAGADLPLVARDEVVLAPSHTVAGNPSRMRNGLVRLDADRRWESQMSSADRRLATAAALPLLAHYGYGVRVPKAG